jgi:hypothetical protein
MMPQKKKSKQPPSKTSQTVTLSLSSLHERRVGLEEEHQWLLKQIKRKRTELKNFLEQMRTVATEMFHSGEPFHRQMLELDTEIHALFDEILKTRKMGKQTQRDVEEVYQTLQLMGVISPKYEDDEEDEDSELDELFEDEDEEFWQNQSQQYRFNDPSQVETESASRSPQSKQIRRTFLKLAEIFHPDKVTDPQTQMHHTEIMKEVNRAYSEGDLAKLLEIEKSYQSGKLISNENASSDDLQRLCERLEADNQILKTQYENLKHELGAVKNTPEGEMVKDYRACVKDGINPVEEMLSQAKKHLKEIEKIRDFIKDFRDKKMTIKEFLKGPASMRHRDPDEMEDILQQMLGELGIVIKF